MLSRWSSRSRVTSIAVDTALAASVTARDEVPDGGRIQVLRGPLPRALARVGRRAASHDAVSLEGAEVVAHRARRGGGEGRGLGGGELAALVGKSASMTTSRARGGRSLGSPALARRRIHRVVGDVRHGLAISALDPAYLERYTSQHVDLVAASPAARTPRYPRRSRRVAGSPSSATRSPSSRWRSGAKAELGHFGVAAILIAGALPLLVLAPFAGRRRPRAGRGGHGMDAQTRQE